MLIFKKLPKSCSIGMDIPLTKESVEQLHKTAMSLKRKAESGFIKAFMSGTKIF